MASITTRVTPGTGATVKNSPLTNEEVDNNFININTELANKQSLTAGSTSTTGYLGYSGTTAESGQINGGTTTPTGTARLNYEGYLYATRIYSSYLTAPNSTSTSIPGTSFQIRGSTGPGAAGTNAGNGTIELIGAGGSAWSGFSNLRQRGGINLQAGTAAADSGSTYYSGSNVDIKGGDATTNGTNIGLGGKVYIAGGTAPTPLGGTNFSSNLTLDGATFSTGGQAALFGGHGSDNAGGGSAQLGGGWAYGAGTGGIVFIRGGDNFGTGNGGSIFITSGAPSATRTAGSIYISVGSEGTNTLGGNIVFTLANNGIGTGTLGYYSFSSAPGSENEWLRLEDGATKVKTTTNATSSSNSGALQVAGGASIIQDLRVGGNVHATSFYGDGSQLTNISVLPSQTGSAGRYLTTDGTTASWATAVVVPRATTQTSINFTTPTAALTPTFGTVLLLNTSNTNTQQNTTFLDSSTNNFTISKTLSGVTNSSYTPFLEQMDWSTYINGAFDNVTAPNSPAFDFGSGDFTIEFWMFPVAAGLIATTMIYGKPNAGGYSGIAIYQPSASYNIVLYSSSNGTSWNLINGALIGTAAANRWFHVAVVRSGTLIKTFFNGILTSTTNVSTNAVLTNTDPVNLGSNRGAGNTAFTGNLSNLRIVKGTALYTSNFTPPTTRLTAVPNTSLLTFQSSALVDNSSNAFTLTATPPSAGLPVAPIAFSPFISNILYNPATHGGSGYFDGGTSYLEIANNAAFQFGTGNFTVEFWINTRDTAFHLASLLTSTLGNWAITVTGGLFIWQTNYATTNLFSTSAGSITNGLWSHVAIVRNGTTTSVYFNGIFQTSAIDNTNYTGAGNLRIGFGAGGGFQGYLSNFRIVKGTAVYTANFTPPTGPLTSIPNTSLLLNFTNAGIYDVEGISPIETFGNVQVSTAQARYGTTSIAFDGTGDFLFLPANSALAFGRDDFAIEFWLYLNTTATSQLIFEPRTTANQVTPVIYVAAGGTVRLFVSNADRLISPALTVSTWNHVAVSRTAGLTRMFINGVPIGTTYTDANSYIAVNTRIGADFSGTSGLNGFIDDFRITRGFGTYGSVVPNASTTDQLNIINLNDSATFYPPVGAPQNGQRLLLRVKDNGVARTLSWQTSFGGYRIIGSVLPTATVANKTTYVGTVYNANENYWDVISAITEV